MDIFWAAKQGNTEELRRHLLNATSDDVNLRNPQFETVDEKRPKKSMYCAICYQRVKRRNRNTLGGAIANSFLCDGAAHQRSLLTTDASADVGCCNTPASHLCNWAVCLECLMKCTYDLKAPHQMYGLQEGFTALIAASSAGHIECVKLLLDHGADIHMADPKGLTPLLAAASAGHAETVRLLLSRGAFIDAVEHRGLSALFMACEVGDAATVEVILSFSPDMTIRDQRGATVLHAAVSVGHLGITQALLDRGHSPSVVDEEGSTPLHFIPNHGSAALVRLLLDRGADIDARDDNNYTPIQLTCLRNNVAATSAFLSAGADTDGTLFVSCAGNFYKIVEVLLAGGVDASDPGELLVCASRNCPQAAAVCLKYGLKGGGNALMEAAKRGHTAVVKVILQHWTGEDDMGDESMNRALALAAMAGMAPAVKLLLEHGADATVILGRNGETAVDFASTKKVKGIIQAHLAGEAIGTEEDDEETVENNREHLLHALKKGTKEWGRSKIMIVGDGRAGKTALANSIMGEEFAHTESTIGINQMTCDVKFAEVGREGQWDEYVKPDKELEAALAKIVAARRNGEEEDGNEVDLLAPTTAPGNAHAGATRAEAAGESSGEKYISAEGASATEAIVSSIIAREAGGADAGAGSSALVIDDALVMRYLANMTDNTKFIISLFDYGGQTVFNVIHHLFLTRYGVYTLVFNMEQLISPNPAVVDHCLSTLSFWLNSVVVHTWNAQTESMAPIIIVGTHKDVVNTPEQHAEISRILHEKFCSSVAWPWIQENEEDEADGGGSLCFFPVDNRKSRKDTTVVKMMKLIEDIIDKSDYVHVKRPLSWLQTMDKLTSSGKVYLSLTEVEVIALECDVPRAAVPSLLSFLHEMGILMWHDDVSLRDIVILDAVSYFVTPVTTIICKHVATATDSTRHLVDVHKKCSKQYYDAWMKMVHQGIATSDVIELLLQECGPHIPVVLRLMIKFGLIVPLQAADHNRVSGQGLPGLEEFLVPALLPVLIDEPGSTKSALKEPVEYANTCYFVFSCSARLSASSTVSFADTRNQGFLPRGLFERLICKAVEWCRETSAVQSLQSQPLFQDAAVLVFGNQKFRMRAFHDKNVIEVNFATGSPLAVHQRLCEQLQQILNECMKSLRFFTAVRLEAKSSQDTSDDVCLISLDHLRAVHDKNTSLVSSDGDKLLDKKVVSEKYSGWLVDDALRSAYDVFISYRWGVLDSRFTECLRDRLLIFNVGEDNRAVAVFLDSKRLRDGRNFVDDFAHALVNSSVIAPVVSADALSRMQNHDPEQKDHALMEWFMALECFHSKHSRVARVLPALFGTRDSTSGKIGDMFAEGLLEAMPEVHPKESLRVATLLLKANGVEPRIGVGAYTVRSIVMEMKSILGFCAWTVKDPSSVVAQAADRIFHTLQDVLKEKEKDPSGSPLPPPSQSAPLVDDALSILPKRTLKEVVDEIRAQLGLSAEVNAAQVFQQALEFLGDASLVEACASLSGLAKAERILCAVLG